MEISLLQERIPDFKPYIFNCKFNDCIHMNEPGCRIQEAVAQGDISPIRYEHYKEVVSMIRSYKPKY